MSNKIRDEFAFHKLNENGIKRAEWIAVAFTDLLVYLENDLLGESNPRLNAIVRTKLEEACFFAKKSMAMDPSNQAVE